MILFERKTLSYANYTKSKQTITIISEKSWMKSSNWNWMDPKLIFSPNKCTVFHEETDFAHYGPIEQYLNHHIWSHGAMGAEKKIFQYIWMSIKSQNTTNKKTMSKNLTMKYSIVLHCISLRNTNGLHLEILKKSVNCRCKGKSHKNLLIGNMYLEKKPWRILYFKRVFCSLKCKIATVVDNGTVENRPLSIYCCALHQGILKR